MSEHGCMFENIIKFTAIVDSNDIAKSARELGRNMGNWVNFLNYEVIRGNELWRFVLVFLGILITMVLGKTVQYILGRYVRNKSAGTQAGIVTIFLGALKGPVFVAIFAFGLNFVKLFLYYDDENGIQKIIYDGWTKAASVVGSIAIAYAAYKLVDVVEFYLKKFVHRTDNELDDMLVQIVRKSVKVTVIIFAALFIANVVVGAENIQSLLLGAGVGGIALALAAQETVANFFGSVAIFADRPFKIHDWVKIEDYFGPVEEVGFRSTRIRTLEGSLVTIPNKEVANTCVENIGSRPFIRRTSNITITYDSGTEKTLKAVNIIKEELARVPEVNSDPLFPPRVFFNEFNDASLNIYMSYWVKPPDLWFYMQINEKVNFALMKRFEQENIEFAFPTQTLYLKKDTGWDDQQNNA